MSEFQREEELLRQELRRREPRDGFAGRVLARLDAQPERAVRTNWWSWLFAPAMAVALLFVLVAGAWQYRQFDLERQRRARAERALGQLAQAIEITAAKIELAQARVFQTEVRQ